MTDPGPHANPKSLHPRLTVVRASAADRDRLVAGRDGVIDRGRLHGRAEGLAAERGAGRATARARLEAAAERTGHDVEQAERRRDELAALQDELTRGAAWAATADEEVRAAQAALEAAEAGLEEAQAEQRSRLSELDKVLEQRATATAAMADAERQLADLGVSELDELGLRRELEASGHAVRAAEEAHAAAGARLAELRAEQAAAIERLEQLRAALDAHAGSPAVESEVVATVRSALETWEAVAATSPPDPRAAELADAWADLQADLQTVVEQAGPPPDEAELEEAQRAVDEAAAQLARLDEQARERELSPEARAELDAAHEAVLAAEGRAGRRLGGGSARRALEMARTREQELLDRYGFSTYLDVMLSGGRAGDDGPERFAAEAAYRRAVAERDRLAAAGQAQPEMTYLSGEAERLLGHCVGILGVDPGDQVIPLLRAHPDVPRALVDNLQAAVSAAGLAPAGQSLAEAASEWLQAQDAVLAEQARWREAADQVRTEADQLAAEINRREREIERAAAAEVDAAGALERATRSVSAFETELSMRADEDARRLRRFAAAEQLRAQVAALAETLGRAEEEARAAHEEATGRMAVAEADLDRALAALDALTRRARSLAQQVPVERRPVGEPLATLDALAPALQERAAQLAPEREAAEESAAAAVARQEAARAEVAAAPTGDEGPLADDLVDALRELLTDGSGVAVVDDPIDDHAVRHDPRIGDLLLEASSARPVVFLTDDPAFLGWAIELPPDQAGIVPADSLNLDADGADDAPKAPFVDLPGRDPDLAEAPTPSGPHRAGRR